MRQDEYDSVWSYKVLFDIRYRVSCAIWDVCNEDVGDSREEISYEKYRVSIASKKDVLLIPIEEGTLYYCAHERLHETSYRFG